MPKVIVFSQPNCGWCRKAKAMLTELGVEFESVDITGSTEGRERFDRLTNGASTVPQVVAGERCLGGYQDLVGMHNALRLLPLIADQKEAA